MGVASSEIIKERLGKPLEKPGSLRIVPLLDKDKQIGPAGVDVHLGCYFLASRQENLDCFRIVSADPAEVPTPPTAGAPRRLPSDPARAQRRLHVPYGRAIILPPSSAILGITLEYIKLPYDMSAQVLTRSSYGRLFITIATATWVHPEFRGCLTLEIINSSRGPIELKPGMGLAQLVFWLIDGAEKPPSDVVRGRFAACVRPVYPPLQAEASELGRFSPPGI